MKKKITIILMGLFLNLSFAQVGVGTTNILNGVEFQVESSTKGVLIPRVALTSTLVQAPVGPAPIANGVLVFNTANNGVGVNAVSPGFYYWFNTEWVPLRSAATTGLQNWSLVGNS